MIRIGIAEDDDSAIDALKECLSQYTKEFGETFSVRTFHNGKQLVFDYQPEYDILFLDIEMPQMDGMTAAGKIREKDSAVIIFFITSMAQYAIQGYRVKARAYILKPIRYISLSLELQDAIASLPCAGENDLMLSDMDGDQVRIPAGKIIYIESHDHDLIFHAGEQTLRTRMPMKEMEEKLSGRSFARPHASFLVNLAFVTGISGDLVSVTDGDRTEKLPISRSRRRDFLKAFSDYLGKG